MADWVLYPLRHFHFWSKRTFLRFDRSKPAGHSASGEKTMKVAPLVLLIVAPLLALGQSSDPTAACGAGGVSFDIKLDHAHQTVEPPQPGKAQVYFIQDTGVKVTFGVYPTTLIGIDGAWVGAYKNNSF